MAQDINAFATNLMNGINQYMGMQQANTLEQQKEQRVLSNKVAFDAIDQENQLTREKSLASHKQDLEGEVSEELGERWLKGGGKKVAEFKAANGRNPKISEAKAFLEENKTGNERNALRRMGMARNYAKDFDNDKDVVKAFVEFNQSKRAKEMLAAGNPVADQAIKVVAARASGEVGNLAKPEQEIYGGSPAMWDWLKRNANRLAEGKLTDSDRNYLVELFDVYDKFGEGRIQKRHKYHSERYARHAGINLEDAAMDIGDVSTLGVANWMPDKESGFKSSPKQGKSESSKEDPEGLGI